MSEYKFACCKWWGRAAMTNQTAPAPVTRQAIGS